jgi:hypothetical protein
MGEAKSISPFREKIAKKSADTTGNRRQRASNDQALRSWL